MNNLVVLYGWKEPWEKLQKLLLTPDGKGNPELLPNKYEIPELGYDDKPGKIVFDVDIYNGEWDFFGIVIRNTKDTGESEISIEEMERKLIEYLKDKTDLLDILNGYPKIHVFQNA